MDSNGMSQSIRISSCFRPTLNTCIFGRKHTCSEVGFPIVSVEKCRMIAWISVSNNPFFPSSTLKDEEEEKSYETPLSKTARAHAILHHLMNLNDPEDALKSLSMVTEGLKGVLYGKDKEGCTTLKGKSKSGRFLSKSMSELAILKLLMGIQDPNDALEILSGVTRVWKTLLYGNPDAETFDKHDDFSPEDPQEIPAAKADLNDVGLDGEIWSMVNDAGLRMPTIGIIKLHDGTPANFANVVCNVFENKLVELFKTFTTNDKVKAILVNIFGGITKCDVIASGIVNAAKQVALRIPVVVRLEGTNVDQGRRIMKESGITLIIAEDLDDAAVKMVKALDLDDMEAKAVKAALLDVNGDSST